MDWEWEARGPSPTERQHHQWCVVDLTEAHVKPPDQQSPPQTIVGGYWRGRLLGSGAYGSVYLGIGCAGQRECVVAIKQTTSPAAQREARLLDRLAHQVSCDGTGASSGALHIVRLLAVVDSSLILEYCPVTLSTVLQDAKRPIPLHHAKHYMHGLLSALQWCHHLNVMHRDIKPANILLTATGVVKVADFGLSRLTAEEEYYLTTSCTAGTAGREGTLNTSYTTGMVTLYYRCPELLLGSRRYSCKIDMWSAGCVLFELLTSGQVLFCGPTGTDTEQLAAINAICGPTGTDTEQLAAINAICGTTSSSGLAKHCAGHGIQSQEAIALLCALIDMDEVTRMPACQAVEHSFFTDYLRPGPN